MDIFPTEIAVLSITNNGNGIVVIDEITAEGTYIFEKDTELSILAVAEENNVFAGWVGDVESTDNPLSVTLSNDFSLTAQFDDVSGIDQFSNLTSIYPNPCTDYFYISNSENISQIVIYNQIGEIAINGFENASTNKIITSDLSPGIYYIHIINNIQSNSIVKLVKQ
jgi:hypothetical protein